MIRRMHVGDERVPVLHPGVDAVATRASGVQRRLQLLADFFGDGEQGGAPADEFVAVLEVFDAVGGRGFAATDVGEIGFDVVGGFGGAVGHQQDGGGGVGSLDRHGWSP
jgi:hypothetical protein